MEINRENLNISLLIKLIFLVSPFLIAIIYFNIPSDSSGIGGGYYDLSLLYYFFLSIPYIIAYGIIIAINSIFLKYKKGLISIENRYILIVVFILLIIHLLYFFIVIK